MSRTCRIHGKNFEISGLYNFWTPIKSNILDVWNWNSWTLFGSETEVRGMAPWPPQWLCSCDKETFVTLSMFWFLRGWGHLGEFVKNGKFVTKIFFLSKKKSLTKFFLTCLADFWLLKVLRQPTQKFWPKILTPYFFFLQLPLPSLPKTMLWKYFQICMYSFTENWKINLTIWHTVPCFNS